MCRHECVRCKNTLVHVKREQGTTGDLKHRGWGRPNPSFRISSLEVFYPLYKLVHVWGCVRVMSKFNYRYINVLSITDECVLRILEYAQSQMYVWIMYVHFVYVLMYMHFVCAMD